MIKVGDTVTLVSVSGSGFVGEGPYEVLYVPGAPGEWWSLLYLDGTNSVVEINPMCVNIGGIWREGKDCSDENSNR